MADSNNLSQPAVRPKVPPVREPEKEMRKANHTPIESKTISFFDDEKNKQHLSALHPSFVHPLENFSFLPLPASPCNDNQTRRHLDLSIERLNYFEINLHILLRLPYHRFWSTVMYDSAVNFGLRSYINNSPRFYFTETSLDDRIHEVANSIHKLVFKLYLRLSTLNESPKNFMSKDYFGKILVEKKIFDIPLLMHICAIYGNIHTSTDEKLVKMLESVLKSHPCFEKQLESSVNIEKEKLNKMLEELGLNDQDNQVITRTKKSHSISIINWSHLVGVVDHIVGTTVPISFFLSLYPPASIVYRQNKFDLAIVEFYDALFPRLKEELNSRFVNDLRAKKSSDIIIRQIVYARCSLINAFRSLVKYSALNILLNSNIDKDLKSYAIDDFLELASMAACSSCFSKDYFSKYSLYEDVYLLMEKCAITGFDSVDFNTIDFLLEAMGESPIDRAQFLKKSDNNSWEKQCTNLSTLNADEKSSNINNESYSQNIDSKYTSKVVRAVRRQKDGELNRKNAANQSNINKSNYLSPKIHNNSSNNSPESKEQEFESEIKMVNNVMIDSMVSHIKDFFPDLSDETVQSLIVKNNYNTEKVIDYILNEKVLH